MKCRRALMMISARQDGELGSEETAALACHLAACAACRGEESEMEILRAIIRPGPGKTAPSPDFLPGVMERVRQDALRRCPSFLEARPARSLAVGAAMFFLLAASYATGFRIGLAPKPSPAAGNGNMEEIYRSVLNISVLDSLAGESLGSRYLEMFNGEEAI